MSRLVQGLGRAWRQMFQPESRPDPATLRLLEDVAEEMVERLSAILGFAEVLAASPAPPAEDLRQSSRFVLEGSRSLAGFMAELHDFARYEQGRLRPGTQQVDIADLVEAALASCREAAEHADLVIVAALPEGVEAICDASRLGRAIASLGIWLAGRARPGSMLRLCLEQPADGGAALILSAERRSFPHGTRECPFAPQLARDGLNGLALAIARHAALLHSGSVTIDTDHGTRIIARLALPAHRVNWPGTRARAGGRAA